MMFYRAKRFLYSDSISNNFTLDLASFGLDAQYKLSDERYMTFYNQPKTPCQAVQLLDNQPQQSRFLVNLDQLPNTIQYLV